MKHVTMEKSEIAEPYLETIIKFINYKAPRVKWGVPESIGNIAKKNPQKVEKAIPYLIRNTIENKDNSTVIRWCSAYALSEIAKASGNKELINKINDIAGKVKVIHAIDTSAKMIGIAESECLHQASQQYFIGAKKIN